MLAKWENCGNYLSRYSRTKIELKKKWSKKNIKRQRFFGCTLSTLCHFLSFFSEPLYPFPGEILFEWLHRDFDIQEQYSLMFLAVHCLSHGPFNFIFVVSWPRSHQLDLKLKFSQNDKTLHVKIKLIDFIRILMLPTCLTLQPLNVQ